MTNDDRAAVERAVGVPVRQVEPLTGLTNRNYRVTTGDGVFAVRLPGVGTEAYIDRTVERNNAQRVAALGVNCDLLSLDDDGTMVCPFIEGEVMSGERLRADAEALGTVARLLRLVHERAGPFLGRFDPMDEIDRHRSALDEVPEGVDSLIAAVEGLALEGPLAPCHNDPWPPNFIDAGGRLYLLDWEYSGMNDPAWDLAHLSVEAGLDPADEVAMLDAYGDEAMAPRLAAHKPITDLVWGLWALVQHADGNPAQDFDAYGRMRLARAARSL